MILIYTHFITVAVSDGPCPGLYFSPQGAKRGLFTLDSVTNGMEDVRLFTKSRCLHAKTMKSCFVTHVYKMIVDY
jgi:hypothetical protein